MAFPARAALLTLLVSAACATALGAQICGNRGTVYWISFDGATKQTTVHVDSGSVWLRANGRTITVKAGQTATKTGAAVPVVKSAPIGSGPPF